MDGFFKINCYPIIFLLSLFSLQSPLFLSWFSRRHGFLHETWFLHVFSSLLINSPANSAFCLCGTIFNAMETSWVGGLDCPYCTCSEQLARSKSMQPTAGRQGADLLRRAGKAIDSEVRQRLAMTFLIFWDRAKAHFSLKRKEFCYNTKWLR